MERPPLHSHPHRLRKALHTPGIHTLCKYFLRYAPNFPHGLYKRHQRSWVPYPSGATDLRAQATNSISVSPYPQKFWSGINRSS